ncbi:MAG: sigma-70 family RNA polymerase sigma factor [Oscillospiraceae bacterium]|nr:sigma-70 family RNA polymerase sigma factor [Oscillospiraceae bacterium]
MDVLYLFHRYRDDVYRLAVNYTRSPQEAEDVCQTVFLKLVEQQELTPGKEKAWLMQVTVNECRDLLRSSWWKRTVSLEEAFSMPQREMDETIYLLRKLPPKYRVVLYLHYYEQYTTPEISQLLKIPAGTVSTRLSRGREQLKKMMKEG